MRSFFPNNSHPLPYPRAHRCSLVTLLEASLATHQANSYVNAASFLGVKCSQMSEFEGMVTAARDRSQSEIGEDRRVVVKGVQLPSKEAFKCAEVREAARRERASKASR
jgi:hypothetical protein